MFHRSDGTVIGNKKDFGIRKQPDDVSTDSYIVSCICIKEVKTFIIMTFDQNGTGCIIRNKICAGFATL